MPATQEHQRAVDRVVVGAYVPISTRDRLVAQAAQEDRSVSSIVRIALGDYLARAGKAS
jgi:hypothetical protein